MSNDYCEGQSQPLLNDSDTSKCNPASIEASFDGCCEPKNPGGHGSFGSLVRVNDEIVYRKGGYCGYGKGISSNVAEYCGAIDALTEAVKHEGVITLRGDNKMVIMQLGPDPTLGRTRWKAKSGLYLPYYERALKLVNQHRARIRFQWVPRELNGECDELSKRVLLNRGVRLRIQPEGNGTVGPRQSDSKHGPWGGAFRNGQAQKKTKAEQPKLTVRRSHNHEVAMNFNKKGGQC